MLQRYLVQGLILIKYLIRHPELGISATSIPTLIKRSVYSRGKGTSKGYTAFQIIQQEFYYEIRRASNY
jgi:hypothetical protein